MFKSATEAEMNVHESREFLHKISVLKTRPQSRGLFISGLKARVVWLTRQNKPPPCRSQSWRKRLFPRHLFTAVRQVTVRTGLLLFLTYGFVSLSITAKEEIRGGEVTAWPLTWSWRTSHTDVTAYYRRQ